MQLEDECAISEHPISMKSNGDKGMLSAGSAREQMSTGWEIRL